MGTPLLTADRVLVTTTTTGTGTYQLGAAAGPTFRTMAQTDIPSGSRVMFVVQDHPTSPTQWEEAEGVYTAGSPATLTRAQVRGGSNGTSAVNWGPGTKYIYLTAFARRQAFLDTDGRLPLSAMPAEVMDDEDIPYGSWSGVTDVIARGDLFSVSMPVRTRRFLVVGSARGFGNAGSALREAVFSMGIRNVADTTDDVTIELGRMHLVPNQYAGCPLVTGWDFGAPLNSTRPVRFRAQCSTGEAFTLYDYDAAILCLKE